jgi:uncharacterized delta-60 repeat protein
MIQPKQVQFNIINDTIQEQSVDLFGVNSLYNVPTSESGVALSGSVDYTFQYGSGFNGNASTVTQQPDGKYIVTGSGFTAYQGVNANRIIRLFSDGSIDTSFIYGTGLNSVVYQNILQPDGKILVGGAFTLYNGVSANKIVRINSDGSRDTSFVIGTGFSGGGGGGAVYDVYLYPDGKILATGSFTSYQGTSANGIIKLNSNGSIDGTFIYGTGFNSSQVRNISVDTNGKILLVGTFTSYQGVSANRIIRLNSDGSIDTSFVYGIGFNNVLSRVRTKVDGKILVTGSFTSYQGVNANFIIGLNSDGSVDTSFNYGSGFSGSFTSPFVIMNDGKIIVGGTFTSYNGTSARNIIRLNANGSVDNSFQTGSGFDTGLNDVRDLILGTDNSIMVTGSFTSYNSIPANKIISLYSFSDNYSIVGGSVDYDFFVQGLNDNPKLIDRIDIVMPQNYLVNPVNIQYKDANGIINLNPYLPNTEIDSFQKATNRSYIDFGKDYIMNINTEIVGFILPPLSTIILVLTYQEFIKSNLLDVEIEQEDKKAKYVITQNFNSGNVSAEKYWGAKTMPNNLELSSVGWLTELKNRFQNVELIQNDNLQLENGTPEIRLMYKDLFGFKDEVKKKFIGITENPIKVNKKEIKLTSKKKTIKPKAKSKVWLKKISK